MKFTLNWLKRHITFHKEQIDTLLYDIEIVLIKLGLELENYQIINPIFAMRIIKCESIENTELKFCTIEVATSLNKFFKKKIVPVVCKADNVREGLISAFCPAGTYMGSALIEKKKISGFPSEGIFIGSQSSILELQKEGIYQFDDIILDITIPTNRWDLKNVRALARNLCFFGLGSLKELPVKINNKNSFNFEVKNNCNVLTSFMSVKKIQICKEIITLMGRINYKNNPLQILNDFILIDIGHPIHIYDQTSIAQSIVIEQAQKEQKILTLSGTFVTTGQEILVKTAETVLAIGGIVGCQGYSHNTEDVILEAIYFKPNHISKIINDTSKIFSLGIDDNQPTLLYISTLIDGECSCIYWSGYKTNSTNIVKFSNNFLYIQTGLSMSLNQCKQILEEKAFECKIIQSKRDDSIQEKFEIEVKPPSWRQDIKDSFSLAEEIVKTIGYDNLESHNPITVNAYNNIDFASRVRIFLCDRGYTECINNPFVSSGSLYICNPIQNHKKYLRESLLESLLDVAYETLSYGERFCRIFEIGKIYPSEEEKIAILACGQPRKNFYTQEKFSFFNFKELIYSMSHIIEIQEIECKENHIIFTEGFVKIIPQLKLIKNAFYAEFSLKSSLKAKAIPARYNYRNCSIEFQGKWQELHNYLKSLCPYEIFLSDLYQNTYTITIKYPYEHFIEEIIDKIKTIK